MLKYESRTPCSYNAMSKDKDVDNMITTSALQCRACGANVPLSSGNAVTCPFCLNSIAVPPNMANPMAASDLLEVEMSRVSAELIQQQTSAQQRRNVSIIFGLIVCIGFGFGISAVVAKFMVDGAIPPAALFSIAAVGVFYGLLLALFIASAAIWGRRELARIAALPKVVIKFDSEYINIICPGCGAPIEADNDAITICCNHCATESLLPAFLVKERLLLKHSRAVALCVKYRRLGEDIATASNLEYKLGYLYGAVFSSLAFALTLYSLLYGIIHRGQSPASLIMAVVVGIWPIFFFNKLFKGHNKKIL